MTQIPAFPHVVVQWQSGVYQRVTVQLEEVETSPALPTLLAGNNILQAILRVSDPMPGAGVEWTDSRREALIQSTVCLAEQLSRPACVVFGECDAVYVKPTGKRAASNAPPTGGVDPLTATEWDVVEPRDAPTPGAAIKESKDQGVQSVEPRGESDEKDVLEASKPDIKEIGQGILFPNLAPYLDAFDLDAFDEEGWEFVAGGVTCQTPFHQWY